MVRSWFVLRSTFTCDFSFHERDLRCETILFPHERESYGRELCYTYNLHFSLLQVVVLFIPVFVTIFTLKVHCFSLLLWRVLARASAKYHVLPYEAGKLQIVG